MVLMRFERVYLLHGKGGSPNGSVFQLEQLLKPKFPETEFVRLLMPHSDPGLPAEASVEFLRQVQLERGAMVIGVSLGGLVAAKLQEEGREDLIVICVSSPTWADAVRLTRKMPNRVVLFGTHDDVIAGRTADWPNLADTHEFEWLTHDTDRHKHRIAAIIESYVEGELRESSAVG
jgi:hypothetical protein